jgi:MFS family permease
MGDARVSSPAPRRTPFTEALTPLQSLLGGGFGSLWLIVFLTGVVSAPVQSLFVVYVEQTLGRPPLFSAGIRSVLLLLGGLFAIPGGALCDRIGVKRTYALGLTGSIAAGALFMTRDPLWLHALALYAGAAFGLSTTGGQSYLIASVPAASLGLGSAAYFIGSTLGNSLGNTISGPMADRLGFHELGRWMVLATAAITVGTALLLPVPPGEGRRSRNPSGSDAGFGTILRRPEVRLLMALRFLPTFYWGVVTQLMPLLIFRAAGTNTAAAHYAAVSLVIAAGFQILTGRLCDRFGRPRPMLIAAGLVALSAVLLATFADSLAGLYALGIMGAASAWSLSTTMPALIADVSGEGEKGRVLGATHFCWSAGMLFGSLAGGHLIEYSAGLAFGAGAAAALLAAVTAAALYGRLALLQLRAEMPPRG